jgi:hypothetical protein
MAKSGNACGLEMGDGMMAREVFDFISGGGVTWNPMPVSYDVYAYLALEVKASKAEENFRRGLIASFPNEPANIERYFRDLKSASSWTDRHLWRWRPLHWVGSSAW